jgi:hypothetical protein
MRSCRHLILPLLGVVGVFTLSLTISGCEPRMPARIHTWMDETKKQAKPEDVQAALVPYFSNERMLTERPPIEITSLPIFADDPADVSITSMTTNNSVLMIFVGSGFGHWGIVVARPGHDSEIPRERRKRLTPWGDGVYFYYGE